jgi:hypothetical protein
MFSLDMRLRQPHLLLCCGRSLAKLLGLLKPCVAQGFSR